MILAVTKRAQLYIIHITLYYTCNMNNEGLFLNCYRWLLCLSHVHMTASQRFLHLFLFSSLIFYFLVLSGNVYCTRQKRKNWTGSKVGQSTNVWMKFKGDAAERKHSAKLITNTRPASELFILFWIVVLKWIVDTEVNYWYWSELLTQKWIVNTGMNFWYRNELLRLKWIDTKTI